MNKNSIFTNINIFNSDLYQPIYYVDSLGSVNIFGVFRIYFYVKNHLLNIILIILAPLGI